MARQIYRKEALKHLSSPEQLDQLIQVTSPRYWIALAAVGLLLLAALLWSWFGTIPTLVSARGILLRRGGVHPIKAPFAGVATRISVLSGDGVPKGQELLQLTPEGAGAKTEVIQAPFPARVLERRIAEGRKVARGDNLLMLENLDEPLRARLFLPVTVGYQVQRDMEVQVWPTQVNRSEFGYLVGKVIGAVKFPVTSTEMRRIVGNEELVGQLTAAGPCLQVVVELRPDHETVSGYHWSSSRGGEVQLYSGSPCEARVIVRQQRPLQLIFPTLGASRPQP
jgi:hypothetical protein